MGSITLTKAKGIWRTLPAPLRGAATLLAVLALAALLTTVRHNASAYLTGVWDTGSQTLVYGRIHQMEQGQYAPGGFLGVYTDDWSDDTNRALFRDDTPTDAAAFHPYTHQSGLQGWLFGRINRLLRHRLPDGLAREAALYWLNSTLFYAAELLVALAVWEEFGPLAAAFGFASVLLAPLAAARHEGPVLVPLDLAAAAAGGALALPLHPRARQNAPRVLAAGGRRLHGALHVRV